MDLEALVTDELREESSGYTLEWFDVEASDRRPPHATVARAHARRRGRRGLVHRRRPDRRDLPRDQRRDRSSTRGCASSASTPSPAARTRSARSASSSSSARRGRGRERPPGVLTGQRVTGAGQAVTTDIIEAAGDRLRPRALQRGDQGARRGLRRGARADAVAPRAPTAARTLVATTFVREVRRSRCVGRPSRVRPGRCARATAGSRDVQGSTRGASPRSMALLLVALARAGHGVASTAGAREARSSAQWRSDEQRRSGGHR